MKIGICLTLTLGELEAATSSLASVFFTFLHTVIAHQIIALAKKRLKRRIKLHDRPRNGVTNSAGLSRKTTAAYIGNNVHFILQTHRLKRLANNHLKCWPAKVSFELSFIDLNNTAA